MEISKLIYNKEAEAFETLIINENSSHNFTLCDFMENDISDAIALANKIYSWVIPNFYSIKKYAASMLLDLKNEMWIEEDGTLFTETKFIEAIKLESLLAFSEGSFQIFFDDNSIFGGHSIVIDIDSDFNFEGAEIAG